MAALLGTQFPVKRLRSGWPPSLLETMSLTLIERVGMGAYTKLSAEQAQLRFKLYLQKWLVLRSGTWGRLIYQGVNRAI
jgi:hypothetical protein